MRPERMHQLLLLCKNEERQRIIELLADLKVLHISDHAKEQVGRTTIDIGTPLANAEELSAALLATRNLLTKLQSAAPEQDAVPLGNRIARIKEIANAYSVHEQELGAAQAQLQTIEQQLLILEQLPEVPLKALRTKTTHSALIKVKDPAASHSLPALYRKEHGKSLFITLQQKDKETLERFEQIDLAPVLNLHGTTREAAARLHTERRSLLGQIQRAEQELRSFSIHAPFLAACEPILALELLKAQAPLHFGATRHITLIKGFVPARRTGELHDALAGIECISELTIPTEAPTSLNNSMKSFESLMQLYTLPKYNEIDPTSLMAFTFPILFGFMLGDIGYGLAALAVAYLVKRGVPSFSPFANIFMISAASTIVFGIIFGEFFGAEQIAGFHLTPLIHRAEDITTMFSIAFLLGLAHINLGLVMGAINESASGWRSALLKKGGWVLVEAGFILIAAKLQILQKITIFSFETSWPAAIITLLIAAVCLVVGEQEKGVLKARGLIEMLSMFSNMLSYARLVALGLASVYLAFVVNDIGTGMFAKGGIWIAIGVLILLVGHAINLVLGLFGPFIHSLRLHYVEFFMKFYEGGGKAYRPFGSIQS